MIDTLARNEQAAEFTIKLPVGLKDQVDRIAGQQGETISDIIRFTLELYLQLYSKFRGVEKKEEDSNHLNIVGNGAGSKVESTEEKLIALLIKDGLMRPKQRTYPIPPPPVSDAELQEMAAIAGQIPGKPLSEIIIEDRGAY